MNWVVLTLIAVLFWSVQSILNKYFRVSYFENSLGYIIFLTPIGLYSLVLLFFEPFVLLGTTEGVAAILSGIVAFVGYYFYIESLHKEEVSRVVILGGISPLFVLVLSTIFLNEILTTEQYIAFALILTGSIIMSFKRVEQRIELKYGALLVLLSSLFFSIQGVLFKYVSKANLATIMVYRQFGFIACVLLVFFISKKAKEYTRKVINDLNIKKKVSVYCSEIIGLTGLFLFYLAVQKGPVSLVSVTGGFQPIFVFILAIIISTFFPKFLKEEINKKTISLKIISIILMVTGLYLISV